MISSTMSLRFLGTSSQPSSSRNYSSLLVNLDRESVMVDCGEGTQRQLLNRHIGGEAKLASIHTILITHLHTDHVLGLVPLLYSMMGSSSLADADDRPRVEIYGPLGLRSLIRTQLTLCYTALQGKYVVHELLWPEQQLLQQQHAAAASTSSYGYEETQAPLMAAIDGPRRVIPLLPVHENELPTGRDIILDETTASWQDFTSVSGVSISAAPILHRCPTLGYVFREPQRASSLPNDTFQRLDANAERLLSERGVRNPRSLVGRLLKQRIRIDLPDGTFIDPPPLDVRGRKICVCGDTKDATGGLVDHLGLTALAMDADVLVHESTNIALPASLSQSKKAQSLSEITEKAHSRGHSTPQGAGDFAARIRAKALILNHFSVRYPAPYQRLAEEQANGRTGGSGAVKADRAYQIMQAFADQATEAWHAGMPQDGASKTIRCGQRAIPSFDGLTFDVWREDQIREAGLEESRGQRGAVQGASSSTHLRFEGTSSMHSIVGGVAVGADRGLRHGRGSRGGFSGSKSRGTRAKVTSVAPYCRPSSSSS